MLGRSVRRLAFAVAKSVKLIRSGSADLLASMVLYRLWRRLRGVDFGIVQHPELGLDPTRASYHKDGGGPQLRRLLSRLAITETDSALDLGSGKGGAMATLARYPFQRVDGVELSPALVDVARRNLAKLGLSQCRVFLGDAMTFADLDDYTVVFMFHPFGEVVFEQVLANLNGSLRRRPRRLRIVYSNPVFEGLILASGRFETEVDYRPYDDFRISVYSSGAR
jgi:SAM-dependent methyltransferase